MRRFWSRNRKRIEIKIGKKREHRDSKWKSEFVMTGMLPWNINFGDNLDIRDLIMEVGQEEEVFHFFVTLIYLGP